MYYAAEVCSYNVSKLIEAASLTVYVCVAAACC